MVNVDLAGIFEVSWREGMMVKIRGLGICAQAMNFAALLKVDWSDDGQIEHSRFRVADIRDLAGFERSAEVIWISRDMLVD